MIMTARRAVYPGSFDPVHEGHLDLIRRASALYDEVIVLIAVSPEKPSLFTVEERAGFLRRALARHTNVRIDSHSGLTVDYMRRQGAGVLVRGLRAVMDFEYEISMANMNRKLAPDIETVLIFSAPEFDFISSRGVKEVARHQGSLKGLVPPEVEEALSKRRPS